MSPGARREKKESGSGPGEEGKSLTPARGTGPVTPLPSAATQTGGANCLKTTRVPSALHVQYAETDVEARRDRVPRPSSSSASMLSPFSTSSRFPSGEIRGFEYRPEAKPSARAAPSRTTETRRVSVKPAGANSSVPVEDTVSAS